MSDGGREGKEKSGSFNSHEHISVFVELTRFSCPFLTNIFAHKSNCFISPFVVVFCFT